VSVAPQDLRVGFVGLGNMGAPMVRNLAKAGFALTLLDLNEALQAELVGELGAKGATTSADFSRCDVVVTMLPDDRAVRSVMLDWEGGIANALRSGAVLVDMSSSNPAGTIKLGDALEENGIGFVDAPVSGGIARAVTGTLALMAGTNDPAYLERVEPVLGALGAQVFPTGPLGSGHAMKALNNFVGATTYVITAEALAIGQHYGLTPATMVGVFNASTARSFNSEVVFKEHVVSGRYATAFALGLITKDVGIAAGLAEESGVDAPFTRLSRARWNGAVGQLGHGADHSEAHKSWWGADFVDATAEAPEAPAAAAAPEAAEASEDAPAAE
jgi:3-hydroxyisobutyrate dehydrogenase